MVRPLHAFKPRVMLVDSVQVSLTLVDHKLFCSIPHLFISDSLAGLSVAPVLTLVMIKLGRLKKNTS